MDKPHGIDTAGSTSNTAPFESMHDLLQAKDDTSRFVGLALLKSVLDNGQFAQDPEQLHKLWEAVPPKFLDRLLRAWRNDKIKKTEAQNMVDLAVAVLHTFAILLPESSRQENRIIARTKALVKALIERQVSRYLFFGYQLTLSSPPATTQLILQTLLTIVSNPQGALEMMSIEDLSPLTEISVQYALVLDIVEFTWANAATSPPDIANVRDSIAKTIPILQTVFKGTDAVTFIKFMGSFLPKLAPEALPRDPNWLKPLVSILRNLVVSRPTLAGRAAYTQLASALLQAYPVTCPTLIFQNNAPANADNKPFSYLFVNLLLIDIRSSFPTLLSQLNSSGYPAISKRLAAAFDVISSFIGFLVRSLDDKSGLVAFSMPPDMLLKLRKDIAETMSLTIEYLRDRWDASFAGASGLHPSARAGTAATSEGTRLTLTWDSIEDDIRADPLILAGIRALAIWIREDDNENLRNESAGIMDMLIELYKSSTLEKTDFRYPILLALEGILDTDDGTASFLEQGGWEVVVRDLDEMQQDLARNHVPGSLPTNGEAARGLEIVRVLLAVLDHPSTSFVQEEWMGAVVAAASMKPIAAGFTPMILEFQISILQLATALLSKAAGGMQKRYVTSIAAILGVARQLEGIASEMDDKVDAKEFVGLLEDVRLELENLRYGL
ncbi:hypothetical protein D0Z07_6683 [Hyphodiscus hymeniophilus]|uniref:DUF1941-domain-containing protein n=1 Tax=Hyphodiscus hymeniophilus TaxID=353542 RepID=A0A9P7AVM6_9HELO|nr:hypothetical protein D0Z07_6683 [Hyphodiscus hymeniophilus]